MRNNISEVAYSVQMVVDAKHYLSIDYKVTNNNDTRAMSGMLLINLYSKIERKFLDELT